MKQIVYIIALFLLTPGIISAKGDKKIKVTQVQGKAVGGINTTPATIIDQAIKNAKINALKEAGIHEEINTFQNLYRSETKDHYEEVFMSDVFTNISGAVTKVEVIDTIAKFNNKLLTLEIRVKINATVIKYEKKQDRTFDAWVKGIEPFYKDGDHLTFTIKPSKNCYARVFLFGRKQDPYTIFPTEHEVDIQLSQNTEQKFPTMAVDYILSTEYKKEPHRAIIVLLKEQIPYTGKIEYKPILDWIFSISPQDRVIKTIPFTVVNN